MQPIIDVKKLSKKYILYHKNEKPITLKEALSHKLKGWFRSNKTAMTFEEFWALRDIDLDIYEGERVGIIGENGAGKSTLLKILSRIVVPTEGTITFRGRLASLLEVGTGFHPDLSGRENIYMNGAVLGMSTSEITSRFDEIVDFAGIERFLDTPVKRYSSGMFARLGFSIAAHLNPDILIVDEVLSVGDVQFQEKCLKKLDSLSHSGKTILFVSHNLNSVLALCNKGVYMQGGRIVASGDVEECVNLYLKEAKPCQRIWEGDLGDENVRLRRFALSLTKDYVVHGETVQLNVHLDVLKDSHGIIFGFDFLNTQGHIMASARTSEMPSLHSTLSRAGKYQINFPIPSHLIRPGEYRISAVCIVDNDRSVLNEKISLALPVYSALSEPAFRHPHRSEGFYLGPNWQLQHTNFIKSRDTSHAQCSSILS